MSMHIPWKYMSFIECNIKATICHWSFEACCLWCRELKMDVSVMWMLWQVAVVETVLHQQLHWWRASRRIMLPPVDEQQLW